MAATPKKKPTRVRVELTPPAGEPLSLWADRDGDTLTLLADPGDAAGWAVKGRGFAGRVAAAAGRTLTVEVAP